MKLYLFLSIFIFSSLLLSGCTRYENEPTCVVEHTEIRHQSAYSQIVPIMAGKSTTFTTIYHPAKDYEVKICDKLE